MNEPLAFLNGRFLPQSQASLAWNDAGFVFGATITDLCRTIRQRVYRWKDHLARFRRSCKSAYIEVSFSDDELTRHADELITDNAARLAPSADLALVIFATPGPIGYYLGEPGSAGEHPTFGMHTFPLPFGRYRSLIEHGATLATPNIHAVPAESVDPRIKQRSRMHWWLADRELQASGAQALLLDMQGFVTEVASSNFLIVKDGTLLSPLRERVLDGISLKVVGELCGRLDIPVAFRNLSLPDCYAADEALLTSTSYCLAGVRQINERKIPWPGPMLKRLLEAWNNEVGTDIHAQIMNNL